MTIPSITPEPINPPADPPTRDDPDNFRTRADDFVDWQANDFPTEIDGFITEMNTTISAMNATAVDVDADAAIALSAKEYVYAVYNAALWLSGTTYDQGDGSIGSNGYTYISLQGSNTNHDPTTDDGTWWKRTNGPWPYNAESQSSSSDITLVATDPRMQRITMTAFAKTVSLPDAQNLEVGPMFWLFNEGDYDYIVTDYGGNALFVVEPGKEYPIVCFLVSNATQNGTWKFSEATTRAISETPVVFDTGASYLTSIVNLDDSTALISFRDATTYYGQVVAISIADGSVLDGPINFNSVSSSYMIGDKLSSTEAVFVYYNSTGTQLDAVIIEYSGGSLSVVGGPTTISSNSVLLYFGACALSSTEIGVVFDEQFSTGLQAAILGWNGTTLSIDGGPTQISSSTHAYMTCAKIDSSNFVVCAELASSNDMYAYSINWNGTDTISENNNTQLGVYTVSGIGLSITQLEDDGTYIWYACVVSDTDNSNTATIEIIKVTKSNSNVAASITSTYATNNIYRTNTLSGAIICANNDTLLVPYAKDPSEGTSYKPFLAMFEWDSTGPSLTAYPDEYELSDRVNPGYISCILISNEDLIISCADLNNSIRGTIIKSRIVL